MNRVLLLRHGASTWNAEGRWQGWLDSPLTEEGEAQAAARAKELARDGILPRAIYTSDLSRALRTAEIIAAHLESPVIPDAGLRERHGGEWQGHTREEIDAGWPGMRQAWRRGELRAPPGGEDSDAMLARVDAAIGRALRHVGNNTLLVVSHHGVVRALSTRAGIDATTLIPNVGGYWFDVRGGELVDAQPVPELAIETEVPTGE
jgi:probable phosphoglycerate mutase